MEERQINFLKGKYSELFENNLSATLRVRELQLRTKLFGVKDEKLEELEKELDRLACDLTNTTIKATEIINTLKGE